MTEAELLQIATDAGEELAVALRSEPTTRETVFTAVDRCLERLSQTGVWGAENRLASGKLWEAAGDLLQYGALLHRARFKPRGYAGDDEMLRLICADWRCEHPLGKHLDDYFQQHAAPRAVRDRTRIVAEAIVEAVRRRDEPLHVVSVGSGPAMDVVWGAEALDYAERDRLHVTLLDLDPQALADASARLSALLPPENIRAARENLYRLSGRAEAAELLAADLSICTGFFDYLNDRDAGALLAAMWRNLRPGGRLLVFNFAPHNPSRALMEWVGNWYLIYRDEAALRSLAEAAGISETGKQKRPSPPAPLPEAGRGEKIEREAFAVRAEATGVDLYIDARRP